MSRHNISHMSLERVLPVVDVAVASAQSVGLLSNVTVRLLSNDSECDYSIAPVVGMLMLREVDLMLGPYCSFCLGAVARYNRYHLYQRPIITSGGGASVLNNKVEYYNLIRVGPSHEQIEEMLLKIFKHYNWRPRPVQTVLVVGPPDEINSRQHQSESIISDALVMSVAIEKMLTQPNVSYIARRLTYKPGRPHLATQLFKVLEEVRIVVLCADPDTVRDIMIRAEELGFINGEYVFFNIDLFSSEKLTVRPWRRVNDTAERNSKAFRAYRSLMTITLRKPNSPEYRNFSRQVKELAYHKYNFTYPEEEVNSFVGAFHDAVLLYALAINDTLREHGSEGIRNGSLVTEKMKSRSFEGITGTVSINKNGDRNADYSLLDMDKDTGEFAVVAHYNGNKKVYELVKDRQIDWNNEENLPPKDIPTCGFDYSLCKKDLTQMALYAVVVLLVLICFLTILIFVIYRKLRLESELHGMNWRIAWEELEPTERVAARRRSLAQPQPPPPQKQTTNKKKRARLNQKKQQQQQPHWFFANHHGTKRSNRGDPDEAAAETLPLRPSGGGANDSGGGDIGAGDSQSVVQMDSASMESVETIAGVPLSQIPTAQLFAKTAYYKGTLVALKQLNLRNKRIEVTNRLLMEVKRVKDLASDNVVRFIGACLDPPNECLVTEYCPKGSLQDILENDNLNLDWMFKLSLMADICRGMIYLHHSFGSHGNLKSSNCMVDSRFSLKIADFGLQSLRSNKLEYRDKEDGDYSTYRNKLWTAPELLRLPNPPFEGTKEGDVYSFAIICQEVIYRKGVFFLSDSDFIEPQDIVERVRTPQNPPFRPALVEEMSDLEPDRTAALTAMVELCWHEDPGARPTFNAAKSRISRFNKTAESGNILDNLLKRMEQYSNNLESLVAKRTDQYQVEKKKAEDLLYCMLPKAVATTLMRGEAVTAEWFDSVSIYFSDICGFTALSSESTPLQVVTLLNDLYTLFDRIIEQYSCYKVETIGDAYMVVSGLPERNGNRHAGEISRMALSFLNNIYSFEIRHMPGVQLKLRIGIHSGPVCAGVVGLKMPRYCLFGDTVNTASRMESNGLPLKIHISATTHELLTDIGNFVTTVRGEVEMKGKGKQLTYWLHGEGDKIVDPPPAANGAATP
uniref:Guanylate cyclase n=1 Tax=Macrostomum lignano TaxID=282301 RepID=A0A1I8GAT2_9PLAT